MRQIDWQAIKEQLGLPQKKKCMRCGKLYRNDPRGQNKRRHRRKCYAELRKKIIWLGRPRRDEQEPEIITYNELWYPREAEDIERQRHLK